MNMRSERGIRLLLWIGYIIAAGLVFYSYHKGIYTAPNITIITLLITLAFTTLLVEHFFTKPSDVLASTTAVILLLLPMHKDFQELGLLYTLCLTYAVINWLAAFSALYILDPLKSPQSLTNTTSNTLKAFANIFGNARAIYGFPFIAVVLTYLDKNSPAPIWWIGIFSILVLVPQAKLSKAISHIFNRSRHDKKSTQIAQIISVQSSNVLEAQLLKDSRIKLKSFEEVAISYSPDGTPPITRQGIVIGSYPTNSEHLIKLLLNDKETQKLPNNISEGSVHTLEGRPNLENSIIGIVREGTSISTLQFEHFSTTDLAEGDMLEVQIQDKTVYYQVVEGTNRVESLEHRNETAFTVGYAAQIGYWDKKGKQFEKYGWVPKINSPVFKCVSSKISADTTDSEIKLGEVPELSLPITVNAEEMVTHHTAIVGVTGTGKSVLTRKIIKDVSEKGIKVICIDFTNEHKGKLTATGLQVIDAVNSTQLSEIKPILDKWIDEMEEFPNKRDKPQLKKWENEISLKLGDAAKKFVESKSDVAILELPDMTNTNATQEYIRWYLRGVFREAKNGTFGDKKIALVLEEAHTIVPEWNFVGSNDSSVQAVTNAIGQIALQGRKYGVGFLVVAQRTANVSKTVLTQCNTMISFQQFDKTSCDFLENYYGSTMAKALPNLKKRHAIVAGKALKSTTPLIFKVPEIEEKSVQTEAKPTKKAA